MDTSLQAPIAADESTAAEPAPVPVYAEYRGAADWHLHLPDSPRGPRGYCLDSHGEHAFQPDLATAELAAKGWAVAGGAAGWTEHPPGEGEYPWSAQVVPAEADPVALDEAMVAVPAGLMEALHRTLVQELGEDSGVDTGTVALELTRAAVRYQQGGAVGGFGPGVVL